MVHDLAKLRGRFDYLQRAFPEGALHTLAVKANPLHDVLTMAVECGLGLETASSGELALARAAGCPPERVVFDSPAKTRTELQQAAAGGLTVNVNSAAELERVQSISGDFPLGLRVNPVVAGENRESATMVATARSKFGIPIEQAVPLLARYPRVSGLHVHVGSQVATVDDLVEAARRVVELAGRYPQIEWLDIGGGLPTRYSADDRGLDPKDYYQALLQVAPKIGGYRLITEMGRALQANCGFAVSRVEYVTAHRAILHFGADLALRECYQPEAWHHEFQVFDREGRPKVGGERAYDLFGPLCFSGDRLAKERLLPALEEGDLVVMHDVGGYTTGMWSRYCSRLMPEVVGVDGQELKVLKRRETEEDLLRFWTGS